MIAKNEFSVGGLTLVWEWDDEETFAGNFMDNNLHIEGIWNMSDTLGRTDTCVGMTGGLVKDNGYDYLVNNDLGIWLETEDSEKYVEDVYYDAQVGSNELVIRYLVKKTNSHRLQDDLIIRKKQTEMKKCHERTDA